jgi:hypothetical protein
MTTDAAHWRFSARALPTGRIRWVAPRHRWRRDRKRSSDWPTEAIDEFVLTGISTARMGEWHDFIKRYKSIGFLEDAADKIKEG